MLYSQVKSILKTSDKEDLRKVIEEFGEEIAIAAHDVEILMDDVQEAYQGAHSSDRDFAMEMAEQLGELDKNATWPHNCIDWEYAAKDLMYDYMESNGHYFRCL